MTANEGRIPGRLFFRIGDVAQIVGVKPYVLRYWETEFPFLSPGKSSSGQRVYRKIDVETLLLIRELLYEERYSIEGARRRIRELRREGGLKAAREKAAQAAQEALARPGLASEEAISVEPGEVIREDSEALDAEPTGGEGAPTASQAPHSTGTAVGAAPAESGLSEAERLRMAGLARELDALVRQPLRSLFRA